MNIEHPEIQNIELVKAREMAEKVISNLEVKIGQLSSFVEDPEIGEEEKEQATSELEEIKEKLAEATLAKTSLDQQYDAEVAERIKQIESELDQAA